MQWVVTVVTMHRHQTQKYHIQQQIFWQNREEQIRKLRSWQV